jgi:hypothetical protein
MSQRELTAICPKCSNQNHPANRNCGICGALLPPLPYGASVTAPAHNSVQPGVQPATPPHHAHSNNQPHSQPHHYSHSPQHSTTAPTLQNQNAWVGWVIGIVVGGTALIALGTILILTVFGRRVEPSLQSNAQSVAVALQTPVLVDSSLQIAPPVGWSTQPGQGMVRSVFLAPAQDGFAANLNIVVENIPAGTTMTDLDGQEALFASIFANYAKIESGYTTLGGQQAYAFSANYDAGTPARRLWGRSLTVLRGSQSYTFTCTALDSNHHEFEAPFQAMLNSVQWN